jgi:hypothetical protein
MDRLHNWVSAFVSHEHEHNRSAIDLRTQGLDPVRSSSLCHDDGQATRDDRTGLPPRGNAESRELWSVDVKELGRVPAESDRG